MARKTSKTGSISTLITGDHVSIRTKTLASGARALFLAIYRPGSPREYRFLDLRLTGVKADDAEALAEAKTAMLAVEKDLRAERRGGPSPIRSRASFLEYYDHAMQNAGKSVNVWKAVRRLLAEHIGTRTITVEQITPQFVDAFTAFMTKSGVGTNTVTTYRSRFIAVLNQAVREGLLASNPARRASVRVRKEATQRRFLTEDELQRIAMIPCPDPELGRAFLFACTTGLRFSDVQALKWKHVHAGTLRIVQTKTREEVVVPLNDDARRFIGMRTTDEANVFLVPPHVSQVSRALAAWADAAGIPAFTFHASRHTYATRLLSHGSDIYTVSKLLGHSDVKTTQIYSRLIDERRRAAVDALPSITPLRLVPEADAA